MVLGVIEGGGERRKDLNGGLFLLGVTLKKSRKSYDGG